MTAPLTEARFSEIFHRAEHYIEHTWGVPVRISDVPDPFTGDLDGSLIAVDYANHAEDALFILVHLFGHTVQWNVDPSARAIGLLPIRAGAYDDTQLAAIGAYERLACEYSMQLLHDIAVTDADQWLSDFASCDAAYLMHYSRTGEKRAFRSFWRSPAPMLTPRPIANFLPTAWISYRNGRVL